MKRNTVSLAVALGLFALTGIASAQDIREMPASAESEGESLLDLRHVIEEYPFPAQYGTVRD